MQQRNEDRARILVLLAEDDPVARNIMTTMVTHKFPGITLLSAENGQIGLELYREFKPDIVMTDINMPVMDGIRMAREIKSLDPDATVIVMSAYNEAHYLSSAREIGITQYVLKPIEFKALFTLLGGCIDEIAQRSRASI